MEEFATVKIGGHSENLVVAHFCLLPTKEKLIVESLEPYLIEIQLF